MKYIPIVYSEQQKKIVPLDTISVAFPLLLQEVFSKSNLGSCPQILDSYLNWTALLEFSLNLPNWKRLVWVIVYVLVATQRA